MPGAAASRNVQRNITAQGLTYDPLQRSPVTLRDEDHVGLEGRKWTPEWHCQIKNLGIV